MKILKYILLIAVVICAFAFMIAHSQKNDNERAEYWEAQMEACGKVGYYQTDDGCEPVEYIKNLNDYEHTNG